MEQKLTLYFDEVPLEEDVDEVIPSRIVEEEHIFMLEHCVTNTPPQERGGATLTPVGGKMYMIGGANREEVHFGEVCAYDPEQRKWEKLDTTGSFAGRSGHSTVAIGNKIIVFGGLNATKQVAYSDVLVFNTETLHWMHPQVTGDIPTGRNSHTANVFAGKMVVFGGSSPKEGPMNDIHVLTINGNDAFHWEKVRATGAAPPVPREMHSSVITKDHETGNDVVVIYGGRDVEGRALSDISRLYLDNYRWGVTQDTNMALCSHVMGMFETLKGALVIFGGWAGGANISGEFSTYELSTGKWERLQLGNVGNLSPRFGHCCCMCEDNMYVFGGTSIENDLNDLHCISYQRA